MAAVVPEQRDELFYASIVPMSGHSVVGYAFKASEQMLSAMDSWEAVGSLYQRDTKTFKHMVTN